MDGMFKDHRIGVGALGNDVEQFVKASSVLVLLHDGHLQPACITQLIAWSTAPMTLVDVRRSPSSVMKTLPSDAAILYACIKDDLGLPFVDIAYARKLQVQPVLFANPRDYLWRNSHAMRALRREIEHQRAAGYLKIDYGIGDFINLIQAYEATRERPGCIVEVGCFCGSSAGALLAYVRSRQEERGFPEQEFHFMDVFEGFDYPEALASSDVFWAGTHQTDGYERVRDRIQAYGLDLPGMQIEVTRANVISDPIPEAIVRVGVKLANIDVDLYEAVAAGLARYAPLIVPGGIMICEDAGHTPLLIGALKAVEEFMASEAGRSFCRIDLPTGQTFLVKALVATTGSTAMPSQQG